MAMVSKNGWMGHAMRVSGVTVKPTVRASYITRTAISMKANGSTIKLTDREFTLMPMERGTKVNGVMTNSMDMDAKHGQTTLCTRVCTTRAKRTAKES